MTDRQKQSIRYMRRMGLTFSAISCSTGLSPNTIKSFCYRENIDPITNPGNEGQDVCKECGKPLDHNPGKKKKSYCSDKCRSDWWNRNREWINHKQAYHLVCLNCGTVFKSYGNKGRKFCGRECYILSRYGDGLP